MPAGVMYEHAHEIHTVYFSHPKAVLPVKLANGQVKLVTWGRRQAQTGELPMGGWAKLDAIRQGRWDSYLPKPVQMPILKFMENDFEGNSHWYDVSKSYWVQGLVARENDEVRIYIVTIAPQLHTTCHDRWPRIMTQVG